MVRTWSEVEDDFEGEKFPKTSLYNRLSKTNRRLCGADKFFPNVIPRASKDWQRQQQYPVLSRNSVW